MSNRLRKVSLKDCLSEIIDYRGKTPKKLDADWSESGYRAISANNVKFSGLVKIDSIKYADDALYKKWMKSEVERGDLLLTSEAPAGQIMLWDSDEKIVLSQRLFALRTNKSVSNKYLKYYLQSDIGQKEIIRNNSGSTVFGISAKTFSNINVYLPDYKNQKLIGNLLYKLDRKIELNNQINAELEAMAKTLYDYWFVQFDFPDADGKPYKSSGGKMVYNKVLKREIPEGWSHGTLDDIGQIVGGSTPSRNEQENFSEKAIPWITPNDLSNNQGNKFISRGASDVTEKGVKSASLKLYPSGTVLLSSRAPIGYMAIAQNELTTNQGFKSFIPNKGYSTEFVYYSVKNSLKAIEQYSSGSTFKEISGSVLKTVKTILPNSVMISRYTAKAKAIFDQQNTLELENQQLSSLRDWLLPMLMNGQVTVK